jgi:hypothetical protein
MKIIVAISLLIIALSIGYHFLWQPLQLQICLNNISKFRYEDPDNGSFLRNPDGSLVSLTDEDRKAKEDICYRQFPQ